LLPRRLLILGTTDDKDGRRGQPNNLLSAASEQCASHAVAAMRTHYDQIGAPFAGFACDAFAEALAGVVEGPVVRDAMT
jgi:hypothetical protein